MVAVDAVVGFCLGFLGSIPIAGPTSALVFQCGIRGESATGIGITLGGGSHGAIETERVPIARAVAWPSRWRASPCHNTHALPVACRLGAMVYGTTQSGEELELAGISLPLVDEDGRLRTGALRLRLWPHPNLQVARDPDLLKRKVERAEERRDAGLRGQAPPLEGAGEGMEILARPDPVPARGVEDADHAQRIAGAGDGAALLRHLEHLEELLHRVVEAVGGAEPQLVVAGTVEDMLELAN